MGIYFRCSGLNGSRFQGKHQTDEAWARVFSFYMDLWLCEQLLVVLNDLQKESACWSDDEQEEFSRAVYALLNARSETETSIPVPSGIRALLDRVLDIRHDMDRAINNAALTGKLEVEILANPGVLIFASCQQAAAKLSGLGSIKFTFLIDEFENLSETQQRYFNTLLREKELPCCFLIGGREWGVRTHKTLSAGEENKRGNEYEWIVLEDRYRHGKTSYSEFCRNMVVSRLKDSGLSRSAEETIELTLGSKATDRFENDTLLEVVGPCPPAQRVHALRLRRVVYQATQNKDLAEQIGRALMIPDSPLLEKLAILKFYKEWNDSRSVTLATAEEARSYVQPLLTSTPSAELNNFLNLWKADLISQIYWENDRRQPYLGFDQFVDMSGFLPRSLLMILKYVTNWSVFFGERPFTGGGSISHEAQNAGVLDAARWFLSDAKPLGQEGEDCDRAIRRLGALLRAVRQADKPTEVSVTSFSTNFQKIDPSVAKIIETCADHRLLIEIPGGRSARNRGSIHRKFQIHPMLAPLFGLSTGRRGELSLKPVEVGAIFDSRIDESEYSRIAKSRIAAMQAPFHGSSVQETLFELN